ncbi:MAG TPA: hypothetical protein V6C63_01865 [Allocoleopsis sp.]
MTRLTDSTAQTRSADWRRHVDPPHLWLTVISGSLVIHLLLAFSFWWSIRVAIAQSSANGATPIELVDLGSGAAIEAAHNDLAGTTPTTTTGQDNATATAPADGEPPALEPGTTAIIPESVDASTPLAIAPSANPNPDPSQPDQPTPGNPQARLPFTPPVLPRSEPSPVPEQDTSQAPPDPNNTNTPPSTSSNIPNESQPPLEETPTEPQGQIDPTSNNGEGTPGTPNDPLSGTEGETATAPAPFPPTTDNSAPPPASESPDGPIAQVPVSQEATPAQFQASVSASAPSGVGDIPDRLATPQFTSQAFFSDATAAFGCSLDPESVRYFGQSVTLRIAIDDQGQVLGDDTVIQEPSGSNAYDQLARCVISNWKFNPAVGRKDDAEIPVFSNLDVQVTISPI